ncbi:MAG: bifunctional alpha,alpha-trehalose-phosphate synthase (UDP-forming)/trehalose-phosphatase [Planctomycetota bacterium]
MTTVKDGASGAQRQLIVVSNRLPISYEPGGDDGFELRASSGGLASALAGLPRDDNFAWVGWIGAPARKSHRARLEQALRADRLFPVFLNADQERLYYRNSCNEVLWPLLHYFVDKVHFKPEAWAEYERVNQMFADAVLELCEAGRDTTVWVHDFHLMLLPQMLRAARPDLAIGFFLHIPFPSSEVYRLLPTRESALAGVLGADQIAFHTSDYALHFRRACLRVLGLPSARDEIEYEGRRVALSVRPIGPDVEHFQRSLDEPETAEHLDELARRFAGKKLVLGVERLDYSKGVPLKLDTFERYLAQDPTRAKTVTLLQVIVPSRLMHPDYQQLKTTIEQRVAQINGRFGEPGVVPVEYMHRSVTPAELAALYRFADVAMVTPLRDGMNLVAQEYVLCQRDLKGILLLSEFAGAAHMLSGAILVNPFDLDRTAVALDEALHMPETERRERMSAMQRRIEGNGCRQWAERCLAEVEAAAAQRRAEMQRCVLDERTFVRMRDESTVARTRHLFLDYDGTLREIVSSPSMARPSDALRQLLTGLADAPGTAVHVVTGRDRQTIGEWLGDLPIHLCAEHGYAVRHPGGRWHVDAAANLSWMTRVRQLLAQVVEDVPHSFVEEKTASIAWHYRLADLDYGPWRARELQNTLDETLANEPAEVLVGRAVIEVRAVGVNKGNYAASVLTASPATFVLAMGDDRTDNDLFRAVGDTAWTIQIGNQRSINAKFALPTPAAARATLEQLLHAWM